MSTPALATGAYQRLARLTTAAQPQAHPLGQAAGAPAAPGSFGALVQDALGGLAETARSADTKAAAAAQGGGNLVDVVTAVAESEVALETVVNVRDRVISAYQEILRMPI